jgi:hypothetical protein
VERPLRPHELEDRERLGVFQIGETAVQHLISFSSADCPWRHYCHWTGSIARILIENCTDGNWNCAIEAGALDGQKLEICWLKDPFDLLALQIEGSGRVILEDGTPLRVNFDSHNGYSFTSISRALIERNLIPREEMSMQRIREWMAAHPDEAAKVRAANRSYVFFRITGLSNEGEPVGALSHLEAGGRAA